MTDLEKLTTAMLKGDQTAIVDALGLPKPNTSTLRAERFSPGDPLRFNIVNPATGEHCGSVMVTHVNYAPAVEKFLGATPQSVCIQDGCGVTFDPSAPEDDALAQLSHKPFWQRYCQKHRVPATAIKPNTTTPLHECSGCGKTWPEEQIKEDIEDFEQRVAPGEIVPSGECPECGSLCHPVDEAKPDEIILVVVEGGIVQDVLSDTGRTVDYNVWDWNDFEDDPVSYWEEKTDASKAVYRRTVHPEVYADMIKRYNRAKKREQDEREAEQSKDPFRDVPAC